MSAFTDRCEAVVNLADAIAAVTNHQDAADLVASFN